MIYPLVLLLYCYTKHYKNIVPHTSFTLFINTYFSSFDVFIYTGLGVLVTEPSGLGQGLGPPGEPGHGTEVPEMPD